MTVRPSGKSLRRLRHLIRVRVLGMPQFGRSTVRSGWRRFRSGRQTRDHLARRVAELEATLDHERLFPRQWAYRRVRDQFGDSVRRGPFQGLTYPDWGLTHADAFSNKLLGSYEQELHPAIERLIAASPAAVVNIGCSEGYYAVGLARRLPDATGYAFDIVPQLQELARHLAAHNGVSERVEVRGLRDHDSLEQLATDALVVCDCEGCELGLLDPARVHALTTSSLLIEAHDLIEPGITETLVNRFKPTHEIEIVSTRPRWVNDYPELDFLPLATRQIAIDEFRGAPMDWLVLTPQK